jgi:hypothetical protein
MTHQVSKYNRVVLFFSNYGVLFSVRVDGEVDLE